MMYNLIGKDILKIYWLKLYFKVRKLCGRRVLVFGNYLGELQFYKEVFDLFISKYPSEIILIAHENEECYFEFIKQYPQKIFYHFNINVLKSNVFSNKEIDLYLSTEEFGIENIFSIYLFHGQPSKALSFLWDKHLKYDAFFLYGPMHKEAFHFFAKFYHGTLPEYIKYYEIGYPKTDKIINSGIKNPNNNSILGIDKNKKTILYAPAFNEYASLREHGLIILKTIAANDKYNIVAKLPIDCLRPQENKYANGGINWFEAIKLLREEYRNIFLYEEQSIDPLIIEADVMITCISSVAFEFLVLKKPVIYIDTPKFFDIAIKETYFPNQDTSGWNNITFINGGKEFGPVVKDINQLNNVIEDVFNNYSNYPYNKEKLPEYLLYNIGNATIAAVNTIHDLLISNSQSNRKTTKQFDIISYLFIKAKLIIRNQLLNPLYNNFLQKQKTLSIKGYIDANLTERRARKKGLSICDYLESQNNDERKKGRRDRIINNILRFIPKGESSILEIGAGTGMYLERLIGQNVIQYEVYEVNKGWKKYLKKIFRNHPVIVFDADGISLNHTTSNTINFAHAHAVFVYLPIIQVLGYFIEVERVLTKNGIFLFDIINETDLTFNDAKNWNKQGHNFAVVIPHTFIEDFSISYGFEIISTFKEIYAGSTSTYYVLKKL